MPSLRLRISTSSYIISSINYELFILSTAYLLPARRALLAIDFALTQDTLVTLTVYNYRRLQMLVDSEHRRKGGVET